ncbi:hypothetical protein IFR05_002757 [Cadophora sp. M221]|nr:hypothetical protein IFR05_002757 [Cadophora sp. M221]
MPSLQYETTSDLPASPETTAAVGNGANDLERTAVELMKARNGEETHLTSIINIVRAAPLTSNPTTASTQESKKLKEFKIFPKLPLETRQYIFRLANDIPGYLEVQIDIAESNDCLKAYGPHDCQENHGENTSFAVITFTTPTSPHPLFSVCKDSRNELIRTTKGVLPAVSGAKILFDPVHTTIYINVMGNFLSVIDYLGGWAFCCKKFCYRFQAIQKLAIDWRCCIHPSTFQDDPCRSDGCDDDDENDYAETCDDFDSTTGPREGVWGGIFKAAFFDLKALEEIFKAIKERYMAGEDENGGETVEDDDSEEEFESFPEITTHSGHLRSMEPKPVRGEVHHGVPESYWPFWG